MSATSFAICMQGATSPSPALALPLEGMEVHPAQEHWREVVSEAESWPSGMDGSADVGNHERRGRVTSISNSGTSHDIQHKSEWGRASSLFISAMALAGVYAAFKQFVWSDREPGSPADKTIQHDEFGADRRERNGTAPGKTSYAAESRNSRAARQVQAHIAHELGYTGKGITVATLDTGADSRHHEIHASLDEKASYNYLYDNHDIDDYSGHGTHVLALIVGKKDGYGMHGVAYDARSMAFNVIRPVDQEGIERSAPKGAIEDAYRRARAGGADVINNSWGFAKNVEDYTGDSNRRMHISPDLMTLFEEMTAEGRIFVFAAGNYGYSSPDIFAGLPVLNESLKDHWVAVASVGSKNVISDFSNRCGVAKDFCLVAPGEFSLSAWSLDGRERGGDEYEHRSGTSMAAPIVTGGVAVLRQAFPELTPPEALRILFDSAKDLGEVGVDEIYGHGLMDLEAALMPKGSLRLASSSSVRGPTHGVEESWIALGGGIGAALAASVSGQTIVTIDDYGRGYDIPVSSFVGQGVGDLVYPLGVTSDGTEMTAGAHLQTRWGENPFDLSHLAQVDLAFGVEAHLPTGTSDISFALAVGETAHALTMGSAYDFGKSGLEMEVGVLQERGSVLGGISSGAFASGRGSARTSMIRLAGDWSVDEETVLRLSTSFGWTDFSQGHLRVEGEGILTDAITVGLERQSIWSSGDSLALTAALPLAVTSGTASLLLPSKRVASSDGAQSSEIVHAEASVDLSSQDRMLDLGVAYQAPVEWGSLSRMQFGGGWRPEQARAAVELRISAEF
jgi:subtilase-type serine protease